MRRLLVGVALVAAVLVTSCQHPHRNHPYLSCVRHNESRGDYTAKNPRSTASGAYQFLNGTWRSIAGEMGVTGYPTARSAPEFVQDSVAYYAIVAPGHYRSHWNGANSRCW